MSDKLIDPQGCWRNKTVAFRVSPEEGERIDAQVAMSGLTKQDYMTARLLEESVVVTPSRRVQRAAAHPQRGRDEPRAGGSHQGACGHVRGSRRGLLRCVGRRGRRRPHKGHGAQDGRGKG